MERDQLSHVDELFRDPKLNGRLSVRLSFVEQSEGRLLPAEFLPCNAFRWQIAMEPDTGGLLPCRKVRSEGKLVHAIKAGR